MRVTAVFSLMRAKGIELDVASRATVALSFFSPCSEYCSRTGSSQQSEHEVVRRSFLLLSTENMHALLADAN